MTFANMLEETTDSIDVLHRVGAATATACTLPSRPSSGSCGTALD